jgi:hypothetical protein
VEYVYIFLLSSSYFVDTSSGDCVACGPLLISLFFQSRFVLLKELGRGSKTDLLR